MENKYCFKSDGTKERGAKIIAALEKLGGVNPIKSISWMETLSNSYYYVDENNFFDNSINKPEGHTLIEPDEILNEKTFPREMYVSDQSEDSAMNYKLKSTIYCILENQRVGKQYIGISNGGLYFVGWKYAVDIKEEPVVELTLDQIAEMFNISVDRLKIKKQ